MWSRCRSPLPRPRPWPNPSHLHYCANIDALKRAGCTDIVTRSAVGSLKEEHARGVGVLIDHVGGGVGEAEAGHDVGRDGDLGAEESRAETSPFAVLVSARTALAWLWSTKRNGAQACSRASTEGVGELESKRRRAER